MTIEAELGQESRRLWHVRHQKLHLIRQDSSVTQNEVFPEAGHIGRVQKRHVGLLGRAVTFAVVTGAASGHHVHPGVNALLCEGDDVLAGQIVLMKVVAAISANIAVPNEQLGVGQAGFEHGIN